MAPRPRADCGRRALASLGDAARRQQTLLALRAVHAGGTPRRRGRAADRRPAWLQAACAELRLRLRLDALRRPCRGTAALPRAAPARECLPLLELVSSARTGRPRRARCDRRDGRRRGGALAALLAFHRTARFRAVVAVAAPPLLGAGMHDPQGVMRQGLALDPLLALGTRSEPCAPLAIVHGLADAVVAPRCAEELLAQALESLRRAGLEPSLTETTPDGGAVASTDYRAASGLVVRRVLIQGAGHAWTGGPGGHPYCEEGGVALTALCARFLRDAGLFESGPEPSP